MADENGGDAAGAEAKKGGVTMSMGKKRAALVAGAFGEEEKKADKSHQKAQDIISTNARWPRSGPGPCSPRVQRFYYLHSGACREGLPTTMHRSPLQSVLLAAARRIKPDPCALDLGQGISGAGFVPTGA